MAFEQGGMASGLLIIAVSIVFAAGFGFLVLHFCLLYTSDAADE